MDELATVSPAGTIRLNEADFFSRYTRTSNSINDLIPESIAAEELSTSTAAMEEYRLAMIRATGLLASFQGILRKDLEAFKVACDALIKTDESVSSNILK